MKTMKTATLIVLSSSATSAFVQHVQSGRHRSVARHMSEAVGCRRSPVGSFHNSMTDVSIPYMYEPRVPILTLRLPHHFYFFTFPFPLPPPSLFQLG